MVGFACRDSQTPILPVTGVFLAIVGTIISQSARKG